MTRQAVCPACSTGNRIGDGDQNAAKCGRCGVKLFTGAPVEVDDAAFETHLKRSTMPVLVDVWAAWCGPCRMMAPVFADFAKRQRGRVLVAKVDTDRNPDVSSRFGIRSIPTLTVHRDGKEVARQVGAVPMAALEELVQRR